MRLLSLILVILPINPAFAQDWVKLNAAEINAALSARVLQYEDKAIQDFFADGRTLYQTNDASWGRWRVDYNQYCSQWPPADGWACYDVYKSPDGLQVRFRAQDGYQTDGRYIDLN